MLFNHAIIPSAGGLAEIEEMPTSNSCFQGIHVELSSSGMQQVWKVQWLTRGYRLEYYVDK